MSAEVKVIISAVTDKFTKALADAKDKLDKMKTSTPNIQNAEELRTTFSPESFPMFDSIKKSGKLVEDEYNRLENKSQAFKEELYKILQISPEDIYFDPDKLTEKFNLSGEKAEDFSTNLDNLKDYVYLAQKGLGELDLSVENTADSMDRINDVFLTNTNNVMRKASPAYAMLDDALSPVIGKAGLLKLNFSEINQAFEDLKAPEKDAFDINLENLKSSTTNAKKLLKGMNLSSENVEKAMKKVDDIFNENAGTLTKKADPAFAIAEKALQSLGMKGSLMGKQFGEADKEITDTNSPMTEAKKKMSEFGKKTLNGAKSLQWFGFRLMMVGRMFSRALTGNLANVVGLFKDWDKSLMNIASGLAALAMSGLLTADMQESMIENMMEMVQTGTMVEGLFALLSNLFATIGNDVIPILAEPLANLIWNITKAWDEAWPEVEGTVQKIGEIIQTLADIASEEGAGIITNFFNGIKDGLGFLVGLIETLKGSLPSFGYWLGVLIAISPVLSFVGLGLFLLSSAISAVLGPLKFLWTAFDIVGTSMGATPGTLASVSAGFHALLIPMLIIIYVIMGIIKWWDELSANWQSIVIPSLQDLGDAWGRLTGAVGEATSGFDLLKIATYPVYLALSILMVVLSWIIKIVAWLIDRITDLIHIFQAVGSAIDKATGGFLTFVGNVIKAVTGTKEAADGVKESADKAADAVENAGDKIQKAEDDFEISPDLSGVNKQMDDIFGDQKGSTMNNAQTSVDDLTTTITDNTKKWQDSFDNIEVKFGEEIADQVDIAIAAINELSESLSSVGSGTTIVADANKTITNGNLTNPNDYFTPPVDNSTTQQTNYITVDFNNPVISSDVDTENLVDEVSRKLASRINLSRVY